VSRGIKQPTNPVASTDGGANIPEQFFFIFFWGLFSYGGTHVSRLCIKKETHCAYRVYIFSPITSRDIEKQT
jgi:hypothetical protein